MHDVNDTALKVQYSKLSIACDMKILRISLCYKQI